MDTKTIVNQDRMWDAVHKLAKLDEKTSIVVLAATIEKSLRHVEAYASIFTDLDLTMPSIATLEKLQEIDRKMLISYDQNEKERTYEYLIDYIDILCQLTNESPEFIRRKLLGSVLAERPERRYEVNLNRKSYSPVVKLEEQKKQNFYTPKEVGQKIGLSDQTIRRMCEQGKFVGAYQTSGGHWRIPEDNFVTTREQDRKAEEVLKYIDRKNQEVGDVDEFNL